MKTCSSIHPLRKRLLHGLLAVSCLVAVPAASAADSAIGQLNVSLKKKTLQNGENLVAKSKKKIEASKSYSYEFKAKVRGVKGTPAAGLVRSGTTLSDFLKSFSPGSLRYLEGEFANPSGKLPVTVLDRKIGGKRKVKGLGKVKISMKLLGTIEKDGTCVLKVSKVKIKSSKVKDLGAIEFMKGSNLFIAAAPEVTFLKKATTVDENAGSVTVAVRRLINFSETVTVNYTTVPGTATEADFTPTSGTVTFGPNENSQDIVVPIIDNELNDGVRRFTIEISNPSDGAFLGSMVSTKIVILDDE